MTAAGSQPGTASSQLGTVGLAGVGVGPLHERVYRYLVRIGRAGSAADVAAELGLAPRTSGAVLRALERQALVSRTGTRPPGYLASPPELALEPLLAQRREELARIRLYARELQGTFSQAAGGRASDLVEVVIGRDRVMRYYLHLVQGARAGFDALTKPPYVAGDDFTVALDAEGAAIGRGVHARSVYESESLAGAPTLTVVDRSIALGEEARATSALPLKLALFDRRIGFVPLALEEPGQGAVVVRPSPLLDALGALFDGIWARAVPLLSSGDRGTGDGLTDRSRRVLLLMSDGLKDESIARALGVSRRTVQKCVTAAMAELGARTRFQAALLARDRGWFDSS
jgi:DNA-binding CsgD family transcriptional regulator/predicted DNA-binding transcriptional regulator